MMELDVLLSSLKERGIVCQVETLCHFADLTLESRRVHCTVSGQEKGDGYAGFWLHVGSGLGFLGLWTGRVFHLPEPSEMADVAEAFVRYCDRHARGTPYSVPEKIVDKHRLEECDLLFAGSQAAIDRLDEMENLSVSPEFSLLSFVEKLTPHVDVCEVRVDGFVQVRLGNAAALVRFRGETGETQSSFPVLAYGGFPSRPEQYGLLRTVSEAVGCSLYDTAWNNRILWDDPYYAMNDAADRPDAPRNARPVE
jgi:hypothetical protein